MRYSSCVAMPMYEPARRASRARAGSSRARHRTRGTRSRRLDVDPLAKRTFSAPATSSIVRRRYAWTMIPRFSARARQLAVQLKRAIGRRRVLHVDPHEARPRLRVGDERLEIVAAQIEVDVEAERSQLDRDVRVEALAVDPRQQVVVLAGDRARFIGLVTSSPRMSTVAIFPGRSTPDDAYGVVEVGPAIYLADSRWTTDRGRPAGAGRSRDRGSDGRGAPRAAPIVEQTDPFDGP